MREMRNWYLIFIVAVLIGSLATSGCYRKGENIPINPPTATQEIADGWTAFENGDYETAETNFKAAKDRDALQAEAYLGLGWVQARLLNFDSAIANFRILQSITQDQNMLADSYAGLAVCYSAMNQHDQAIEEAQKVLAVSPDYSFIHDDYINTKTLYIVMARAYINKGDYLSATELVDQHVEPGFIDKLLADGVLVKAVNTETTPIVGAQTVVNSQATIRLTKTKNDAEVPIELVKVLAVKSQDERVLYEVVSFDQGGSDISFKGNPIPQEEDIFKVDIIYASDYGIFLSRLFKVLETFRFVSG